MADWPALAMMVLRFAKAFAKSRVKKREYFDRDTKPPRMTKDEKRIAREMHFDRTFAKCEPDWTPKSN